MIFNKCSTETLFYSTSAGLRIKTRYKAQHAFVAESPAYMTVDVVVAHPAGGDARRVSALELAGTAGRRSAFHLVRAVATFVLAVAHKVLGYAAAAGARELVCSTGDVT